MQVDYQVIRRYLDGKEKTGDKKKILDWFSSFSAEKNLREKYFTYWKEMDPDQELEGYDGSKVLGEIYHQLKLEESENCKQKNFFSIVFTAYSRIAAILLVPLLLLTYLFVEKHELISFGGDVAYSEILSPPGSRTMFYLPDGTQGWLNRGASLEFPLEFRGKSREVKLQGEAYFNVQRNENKPFIVTGQGFEVEALGTSFNINAYPDDREVKVTLIEGKVEVSGKKNGTIRPLALLEPNQMCTYNTTTSMFEIEKVNAQKVISWKDGKLVFRNESFDEVVKRINRWYNAELIIKDERLKSYIYMATFQDETLDEVLKLLKLSAPLDYKDLGREIRSDGTYEKRKIELYYNP